MEFAHENAGDVVVAKLAGRLDSSSAATAEEQLTRLIANSAPRLVIDLSKLEYISSAGLRVLLLVARKVQQAQGKLALFGLAPGVRDVFSISGFDTIFTVRDELGRRQSPRFAEAPAMLGFVEEIVLLQLDERGKLVELPMSAADVVLAGAALMELALRNKVDTDINRFFVVDREPTGDEILDDALGALAAAGSDATTSAAIERITLNAHNYRDIALKRLVEKGVLREEEGRFLWVFHTRAVSGDRRHGAARGQGAAAPVDPDGRDPGSPRCRPCSA